MNNSKVCNVIESNRKRMKTQPKKYRINEAAEAWSRVDEASVDYGRAVKKIIKSKTRKRNVSDKDKKVG